MYEIYTIQEGDTLDSIASKFNTTLERIYELNQSLNPMESIQVGKRIIVPVPRPPLFEYYTIKKGDNLYNIAQKFGVNYNTLAQINGLDPNDYIYDNQILIVPKEGVEVIVTKSGDTLEKITKNLDTNALELLFQNANIYLLPDQIIAYRKTSNKT